jgi:hypothetical protein
MSFSNKAIYKEDDIELFIANDYLKLLRKDSSMARSIIINFCPICGRNITKG